MSRWVLVALGAWVLWHHQEMGSGDALQSATWEPLNGFESRAACVVERDAYIALVRRAQSPGPQGKLTAATPVDNGAGADWHGGWMVNTYFCLPDGTDPRPRGKE